MHLCSLIEELCTKEENDKASCNFNFGHECSLSSLHIQKEVDFVTQIHLSTNISKTNDSINLKNTFTLTEYTYNKAYSKGKKLYKERIMNC